MTTTVVSGNCADDPLYIPEIKRVQASLETQGLLHIGDCKMSSLETLAWIAHRSDHYLCPLSAISVAQATLEQLLVPVWREEQPLTTVYRPQTEEEIERQENRKP